MGLQLEPPRPGSEILPGAHRQCFLRPGHHAARSTALQRPSGAWSNAHALAPRHCALDANSRRHRRLISPTICVRPDLAALAPWRTQTVRAARCTTNLTGTPTPAPPGSVDRRTDACRWLESVKGRMIFSAGLKSSQRRKTRLFLSECGFQTGNFISRASGKGGVL